MKIAVFGCGEIYKKYKELILQHAEIVFIIDNNPVLQGTYLDGIRICNPNCFDGDEIDYIALMSDAAFEMREQLVRCGYDKSRIKHYKELMGEWCVERLYYSASDEICKRRLLIVSNPLGYHGVGVVSLRAAICAKQIGFDVTIVSSHIDERYIKEANDAGISIVIQKFLETASEKNLIWMSDYEIILFNSLPMVRCALKVNQKNRKIVWLHENEDTYDEVRYWSDEIQSVAHDDSIAIFAVSNRARNIFLSEYRVKRKIEILFAPIEDWNNTRRINKNEFVIVLIGNICQRKGQDIFLDAIRGIPKEKKSHMLFLLIGSKGIDEFSKAVYEKTLLENNVILLGERSQQKIRSIYSYIDLVVVPSREETLSMVAVESMMMRKTCIVSDHCGIAEYISDGVNGFVFKSEDVDELTKMIVKLFDNKVNLNTVGEQARKLYEEHFSIKKFEERLSYILA